MTSRRTSKFSPAPPLGIFSTPGWRASNQVGSLTSRTATAKKEQVSVSENTPAPNEDLSIAQEAVLNRIQQLEDKVNMQQLEIKILKERLTNFEAFEKEIELIKNDILELDAELNKMKSSNQVDENDDRVVWLKQRSLEARSNSDVVGLIQAVYAALMGIPNLEACNIPEHHDIDREVMENWPIDPDTGSTYLRFHWDKEITDIENWMGLFYVYREVCENGRHYSDSGSNHLKNILKDDLMYSIKSCWKDIQSKVQEYRAIGASSNNQGIS